MMALGALAYVVIWPRLPCQLADPRCSAHQHLLSAAGLIDTIVTRAADHRAGDDAFPPVETAEGTPRMATVPAGDAGRPGTRAVLVIVTAAQGLYAPGAQEGLFERSSRCSPRSGSAPLAAVLIAQPHADP
jgi:hypothetical protein